MKKLRTPTIARPSQAYRSGGEGSRGASVQLVRVEYELARLNNSIQQSENRAAACRRERKECLRQRSRLLDVLANAPEASTLGDRDGT